MGRKQPSGSLTRLELRIMDVLWKLGPATVQQVLEKIQPEQKFAYTTLQTMLTVLYRKGKVTRILKGKAYEYAPALSRKKATNVALRDVLKRFFGGSAESLVMSLVESRQLSAEKLGELTRLIEQSEAYGKKR
ncbi:MAG TPA: BlaI/MecI/CopY family transcriptional regulator [Terriglobales bacterium]|nr:BlaI/MecI/CopY family transcriptional regulator [Terriglobales bacterium]